MSIIKLDIDRFMSYVSNPINNCFINNEQISGNIKLYDFVLNFVKYCLQQTIEKYNKQYLIDGIHFIYLDNKYGNLYREIINEANKSIDVLSLLDQPVQYIDNVFAGGSSPTIVKVHLHGTVLFISND